MNSLLLISRYEELSFNEWPALRTLFYDGWILRISRGYTKRANSVSILSGENQYSLQEKIDYCEELFYNRGLKPTFKLTTPFQGGELEGLLEDRGYKMCNAPKKMRFFSTFHEKMPGNNGIFRHLSG